MRYRLFLTLFALTAGACQAPLTPALPDDHPASPRAAAATLPARSAVLDADASAPPATRPARMSMPMNGGDHADH